MLKTRPGASQVMLVLLLLGMMLVSTGCGGDAHVQQQANQNKTQLDQTLQHAETIGVPMSLLNPIVKQEQQLSSSSVPFTLFNDQPATDYYRNLATRYNQLYVQLQGLITSTTEQFQAQAQHDMQNFQDALTQRRIQKAGNLAVFSDQFSKDQALLAAAQYPKDYVVISQDAHKATAALNLMGQTYTQLTTLNNTIAQMQAAHIDTTAMQTQYQSDLQFFNKVTEVGDFQNLQTLIDAQYQQAVVSSIESLPYVGKARLDEFRKQLNLLKTYGMDASSYQKMLDADQANMNKAKTIHDFLVVSKQIDADLASMHDDLVQGEANYLIAALDREAKTWGQAHAYHDSFDGQNYILTAPYTQDGIGYWLNRELGWLYTPDDFQGLIDEEKNEFFNLHMLEADYLDKTPFDQVHATDLQMMDHYNLHKGQVMVISLVEQALRLYQDGKLVKAFHVTTGRVERPSLPGVWSVQDRKAPTTFKSTEPKDSPYWYPDTPINYAILYHWGGFFVHDAWWRADYGPGTQFPHVDSGGDQSFAGNGSHGCVNVQEEQAAWLYAHTDWNTQIVIY